MNQSHRPPPDPSQLTWLAHAWLAAQCGAGDDEHTKQIAVVLHELTQRLRAMPRTGEVDVLEGVRYQARQLLHVLAAVAFFERVPAEHSLLATHVVNAWFGVSFRQRRGQVKVTLMRRRVKVWQVTLEKIFEAPRASLFSGDAGESIPTASIVTKIVERLKQECPSPVPEAFLHATDDARAKAVKVIDGVRAKKARTSKTGHRKVAEFHFSARRDGSANDPGGERLTPWGMARKFSAAFGEKMPKQSATERKYGPKRRSK